MMLALFKTSAPVPEASSELNAAMPKVRSIVAAPPSNPATGAYWKVPPARVKPEVPCPIGLGVPELVTLLTITVPALTTRLPVKVLASVTATVLLPVLSIPEMAPAFCVNTPLSCPSTPPGVMPRITCKGRVAVVRVRPLTSVTLFVELAAPRISVLPLKHCWVAPAPPTFTRRSAP